MSLAFLTENNYFDHLPVAPIGFMHTTLNSWQIFLKRIDKASLHSRRRSWKYLEVENTYTCIGRTFQACAFQIFLSIIGLHFQSLGAFFIINKCSYVTDSCQKKSIKFAKIHMGIYGNFIYSCQNKEVIMMSSSRRRGKKTMVHPDKEIFFSMLKRNVLSGHENTWRP